MQFHLRAVNARHDIVALTVEAANEALAIDAARSRGLTVVSARRRGAFLSSWRTRSAAFPVVLFAMELKSLLDAGLNLVEALQTLSEKETRTERQSVLAGILSAIRRGESISQALAHFPEHFPSLFAATLRASERTGSIREALSRYIAYQEELDSVRKKIIAASIYPVILMIVGSLVMAFLMFYVVPRFATVYEDMAGRLPFFSSLLLAFGRGIEQHGWVIAGALLGIASLCAWSFARAPVRAWLYSRLWLIPAVGERMRIYQLSRLYRTAGMLLRAGIPAVQSLDMVRDLLASHLQPRLSRARAMIEQGQSMSAALGATGLTTPVAARMLLVGERSGEMGEMLEQISRFHDDEMSRFIDWFTRAFEPVLMAVLGIAIGLVVVLMYMPIFELAGSIQ
jgi:general secretion pathway protein F